VRHGDNPGKPGDPFIFGDVTKWLVYTNELEYMDKDFLHDGIYDYNHIGSISVSWRPRTPPVVFGAKVPLELSAGYGLSYTYYEDGTGAGRAVPNPEWKNIVTMGVTSLSLIIDAFNPRHGAAIEGIITARSVYFSLHSSMQFPCPFDGS